MANTTLAFILSIFLCGFPPCVQSQHSGVANSQNESEKGANAEAPDSCSRCKTAETWLEKVTDPLTIITFAIAAFTLGLIVEANERGKTELRAYIGIKKKRIRRIGENDFQAVVTIENCGKTPAQDVRQVIQVGVGSESGPDEMPNFPAAELSGPMPLAPKAKMELRVRLWKLKREDIPLIAVANTGRRAFAWGRIEYLDIYKRPHHVDFRFETREISRDKSGHAGWALSPTKEGNSAT